MVGVARRKKQKAGRQQRGRVCRNGNVTVANGDDVVASSAHPPASRSQAGVGEDGVALALALAGARGSATGWCARLLLLGEPLDALILPMRLRGG